MPPPHVDPLNVELRLNALDIVAVDPLIEPDKFEPKV